MINRIIEQANSNPKKIAYVYNNKFLTYGELLSEAKKLVLKFKCVKTTNIVLYGHKEFFMPIGIVACLIAKKTYIPIDYYWPEERIKTVLGELKEYLVISEKQIDGIVTYGINDLPVEGCSDTSDIVYIIFTSGSTGIPKGVPISYDNLKCFVDWISNTYPLCKYKDTVIFDQASFSFDLSVSDFYFGLCNGHTLISYDKKIVTIDFLKINQIELLFLTPSYLQILLFDPAFNEKYLDSLKCVYLCGEQLNKKIVIKMKNRFKNVEIINAYGPTEATSAVSMHLISDSDLFDYKYLPVGDLNNTTCKVFIKDNEIVLCGKSVFEGYLSSSKELKEYPTGDVGEIKDGLIFCKGRKDKQIKYSGYRIELEEIENAINSIDEVDNCIVKTSRDNNDTVISIDAIISTRFVIEEKMIRERLNQILPSYMIPKNITFVDKLILNDNNKINLK